MKQMPGPLAIAWAEYEAAGSPFTKLHRLIDAYEALIKYTAVIAIQNFYATNLATSFPEVDRLVRQQIIRPSLGNWVGFLREVLRCFAQRESDLFCRDLFLFYFRDFGKKPKPQEHFKSGKTSERLQNLRNRLAHGATLPDDEAAALIIEHEPDLRVLLDIAAFLAELPLLYVEEQTDTREIHAKPLVGANYLEGLVAVFPSLGLGADCIQHVVIHNPQTNVYLDLHPLLVFTQCAEELPEWDERHHSIVGKKLCGQRKVLFFNDLRDIDRIAFLDYWRGHHSWFKIPSPLANEFQSRFPRPQSPTPKAQWFDEYIRYHTTYFTGREGELNALGQFVTRSTKRAQVVIGAPGMGKSALLAKWAEQHKAIRHFIRQGDAATYDIVHVFDNLALQLSERFNVPWKRPDHREPGEYRQAFERVLAQAVENAQEPIYIVVDGLDEAVRALAPGKGITAMPTILDWLPEPDFLPGQVHLVLSTRPELQNHTVFAAKFGPDKAAWLELSKMTDAEVRALLFHVYSKYEVLEARAYVDAIVKQSEGSPLYLRMLVEDLAEGRLTFGQIEALPRGVVAYFERILEFIENEGYIQEIPDIGTLLQAKREILETLVIQGILTFEQSEKLLERERVALEGQVGVKSIELLALYCLIKEPLSLAEAAIILSADTKEVQRAFEVIRTVLVVSQETGFAIFHAGFRDYFLNLGDYTDAKLHRYANVIAGVRTRLLDYCSRWSEHRSGYVLRHYASHLAEAGEWERLHVLVATGVDSQPWAETRHTVEGSYAGYLHDLSLAWAYADEAGQSDRSMIGRQVLYALIKSSIHNLAGNIPDFLLLALVNQGIWSPQSGLDYARQIPDLEQRVETLIMLAPYLPESLLLEALTIMQGIQDIDVRMWALAGLASHLPGALGEDAWQEALAIAREIRVEWALSEIVSPLQVPALREALTLAQEIGDEIYLERALACLAPKLPNSLKGEALSAAQKIGDEPTRAGALVSLAPHLPKRLLQEALRIAQGFESQDYRVWVAAELFSYAPKHFTGKAQEDILTAARGIEDAYLRARALGVLACHLMESLKIEVLDQALAAAREINDESTKAKILTELSSSLLNPSKEEALREALAAGRKIGDKDDRWRTLAGLASYLPEPLMWETLRAAKAIQDESDRVGALTDLAHCLADLSYHTNALATARDIEWLDKRGQVLADLALNLPEPLKREALLEALALARRLDRPWMQTHALAALVPLLAKAGYQEQGLALARELPEDTLWYNPRAAALAELAPYLQGSLLQEALTTIRQIKSEDGRVQTLAKFAPYMWGSLREQVVQEALAAAQGSESEGLRAVALAELISHLPELLRGEVIQEALTAVRGIQNEYGQVGVLVKLLSVLPEPLKMEFSHEALAIAMKIEDGEDRADALAKLAPYLPEPLRKNVELKAIAIAREIEDPICQSSALSALASSLPEPLLRDVLVAVWELESQDIRAELLDQLSPRLATASPDICYSLWRETLQVLAVHKRKDLLFDLRALKPVLVSLGGSDAVKAMAEAVIDVGRWW